MKREPDNRPQVEDEDGLKMFCCEAESRFDMVVMARNAEEAEEVALEFANEEHKNYSRFERFNIEMMQPVKDRRTIPSEWANSNPYYLKEVREDRTVGEIIDKWEERQKAQ